MFFPLTDVRMFDNLRVVKMNRNPHAMSQWGRGCADDESLIGEMES